MVKLDNDTQVVLEYVEDYFILTSVSFLGGEGAVVVSVVFTLQCMKGWYDKLTFPCISVLKLLTKHIYQTIDVCH